MKKRAIIFSVLAIMATMAQAQFSQFHVGGAFSTGKFADGDVFATDVLNRGRGAAATGFTAGYKRYVPLSAEKNLSVVWGIEAFYNELNLDAKDAIEDAGYEDITNPKYLNVPATLGLNYAVPLSENIKFYGEVAVGVNFSVVTKFNGSIYNYNYDREETRTFTPAFGLAYGLEGGLFIRNKYSIGLRYNNLGSYKYRGETETETIPSNGYNEGDFTTQKAKFGRSLPITNISLCFGVLF